MSYYYIRAYNFRKQEQGIKRNEAGKGKCHMRIHVITGAAKYNQLLQPWKHFFIGLTLFQNQVSMGGKRNGKWEIFHNGFQLPLVESPLYMTLTPPYFQVRHL